MTTSNQENENPVQGTAPQSAQDDTLTHSGTIGGGTEGSGEAENAPKTEGSEDAETGTGGDAAA